MAEVSIDGNPPVKVNCYAPERIPYVLSYSKSGLPMKQHIVRIRHTAGTKAGFIEVKRLILFESNNP